MFWEMRLRELSFLVEKLISSCYSKTSDAGNGFLIIIESILRMSCR